MRNHTMTAEDRKKPLRYWRDQAERKRQEQEVANDFSMFVFRILPLAFVGVTLLVMGLMYLVATYAQEIDNFMMNVLK